jgi:tetraacyldisaccharide 4'-kinase
MKGDYFTAFPWRKKNLLLYPVLMVFLAIFSLGARARLLLYRIGLLRRNRLPCPVISVGNITAGGSGKTPLTAFLAQKLTARGKKVAILTRGYGGSFEAEGGLVTDGSKLRASAADSGDEPFLLALQCPGVAIAAGADRFSAAFRYLLPLKPDIIILDDGFSHLRLQRDLDLLLIDGERGLGNTMLLPAGPMREPLTSMARADLVIYTKKEPSTSLSRLIENNTTAPKVFAIFELTGFKSINTGKDIAASDISDGGALAIAGIANPQSCTDSLAATGIAPLDFQAFGDHHNYTEQEIKDLNERAQAAGADYIVVTEKDAVKLAGLGGVGNNWLGAVLAVRFNESDGKILDRALDGLF